MDYEVFFVSIKFINAIIIVLSKIPIINFTIKCRKLSEEEANERFEEIDSDQNGTVTWSEYISETYGIESEYRIPFDENNSFEPVN